MIDLKKQNLYMKSQINTGSLLYTWVSSKNGKLGIGVCSDATCGSQSYFVRQDLGREIDDYQDLSVNRYYTY